MQSACTVHVSALSYTEYYVTIEMILEVSFFSITTVA
jgi:hypothetical protein